MKEFFFPYYFFQNKSFRTEMLMFSFKEMSRHKILVFFDYGFKKKLLCEFSDCFSFKPLNLFEKKLYVSFINKDIVVINYFNHRMDCFFNYFNNLKNYTLDNIFYKKYLMNFEKNFIYDKYFQHLHLSLKINYDLFFINLNAISIKHIKKWFFKYLYLKNHFFIYNQFLHMYIIYVNKIKLCKSFNLLNHSAYLLISKFVSSVINDYFFNRLILNLKLFGELENSFEISKKLHLLMLERYKISEKDEYASLYELKVDILRNVIDFYRYYDSSDMLDDFVLFLKRLELNFDFNNFFFPLRFFDFIGEWNWTFLLPISRVRFTVLDQEERLKLIKSIKSDLISDEPDYGYDLGYCYFFFQKFIKSGFYSFGKYGGLSIQFINSLNHISRFDLKKMLYKYFFLIMFLYKKNFFNIFFLNRNMYIWRFIIFNHVGNILQKYKINYDDDAEGNQGCGSLS